VQQAQENTRKGFVRNAQLAGEDPQGAILKADQEVALARIRSLVGNNDGPNAQKVLDESRGVLGSMPNYDQIVRQVKETVVNSQLGPAIDKAVNEATTGALSRTGVTTGTPDVQALTGAILGQESGNRDNIGTSTAGAIGPGQIEPGTFKMYAKPGEVITNPADNRAVAGRILADYAKKYDGDPQRVAVAYFSGPGNVAPAGSPTPWLRDAHDTNGKSVSSYVADVQSRLAKYPTAADALDANMDTILTKAQGDAERLFPNYPDAQERYVQGVQRRLERTISQQHQLYEVDTHIVQSEMAGPNPPISEEELVSRSPQVAQAWNSMRVTNPYGAMGVERMFDANAHGAALTYGAEFKGYLDRVLAPSTDPNRISSPSGLWPYVGKGDQAVLTNTGVNQLSELLSARSTPQGEAFAAQTKAFIDQMHANLTFSNRGTGIIDERGEALFNRFMAQALPVILTANKNGNLGQIMNPKSPDYLGNLAQTFARSPAQMMDDRLKHSTTAQLPTEPFTVDTLRSTLAGLDNDQQRVETLKAAVAGHRLTPEVYKAYLGQGNPGADAFAQGFGSPSAKAAHPGPVAAPAGPVPEWQRQENAWEAERLREKGRED
jgi:hypothetical protein